MKIISTFIALLSFLLLLLAFNINIDLSNLSYYLGGSQADFYGIEGTFKTPFLIFLSITNVILLVTSFAILHKKTLINIIYAAINMFLFILSFIFRDERTFQGYSFNPTTDNELLATTGTGYGYLFSSSSDIVMILAICSYIAIFSYLKKVHNNLNR